MLGGDNLREIDLRQSISNINYNDFNHRDRNNCRNNCKNHVKSLLCYCFGITVYLGSCALSFYAGHLYGIDQ